MAERCYGNGSPTHAYTHAFREVDAQLSVRERVVANLLLTEGRTA